MARLRPPRCGVTARLIEHGPVRSLAEAATARGVEPADVIKTMVVRRGEGDYVLVLVPGDRVISWPKLRALLGVNRLSMPDADEALAVTGYPRGTITPFGTTTALPVIADERMSGRAGHARCWRAQHRHRSRRGYRTCCPRRHSRRRHRPGVVVPLHQRSVVDADHAVLACCLPHRFSHRGATRWSNTLGIT